MNRREYAHYFASLEIEIREVGSDFPARGATTDVSLSGCYVATMFPLAAGSQVRFAMRVAGENITGRGSVQTCHPGVGMGIHFTDLPDRDSRTLDRYLRASAEVPPPSESVLPLYLR